MFRLALINPNTDERHTMAMLGVARDVLPEGSDVTAINPTRGPSSIESEADAVIAAAEVAALVQSLEPHDAYLIACFGDPGLDAARELTSAPVVGIGEAAFAAATHVAKRFGIVTTLPRGIPALEEQLEALGIRSSCAGILPLNIPVAEQGSHNPDTTPAIVEAGRTLVDEHGAEALILACGGMADVARQVQDATGVPVCDGVAFGAMLAYSLWACGLRTSKAGAYAEPEQIAYIGMEGG
jgi:allantoin racemase